jgi:hypothetical protein
MVRTNVLLATLLVVGAVFLTAAAAAPLPSDQQPQSFDKSIRTTLRADLTMKSELSFGVVSASENGHTRLGFCQCGCGIRCETSADCGGAPCRPFITCCVQGTPEQSVGLGKSTRYGEEPAIGIKCK